MHTRGQTGNGDVVSVYGSQAIRVLVIGCLGQFRVDFVEHRFGGSHFEGEGAYPAYRVFGCGSFVGHFVFFISVYGLRLSCAVPAGIYRR